MADLAEIGATGLKQYGGVVREEFLPELQGDRAVKVYTEMAKNDPIAGATLYVLRMLIRRVTWTTEPGDGILDDTITAEDRKAAEFVESCRRDMSRDWSSVISEILSFLTYGWTYHELVYKLRSGAHVDPSKRSRYSDGKIGWRKMDRRGQSTLRRWQFDEEGGLQGMVQSPAPDYRERIIPIEKALLFRTTADGGNPEGESVLRTAYRPWYYKKRFEETEGIGVERDIAGLPTIGVPADWLTTDATDGEKAAAEAAKRLVTQIRQDQQAGIVYPLMYDANGNQLYKVELLTSGGKRQFDTGAIIQRKSQEIAMCVLADFILLGHEKVGSYALGVTKAEIFTTAVEAFVGEVAGVLNRHAIPRLLAVNGMSGRAHFKPGAVERIDLAQLGDFLQKTTGIIIPDGALEDWLRELAKAPPREDPDAPRPAPGPAAKEVSGDPAAAEKRRPFADAARALPQVSVAKVEEGEHVLLAIADRLAPEVARQFLEAVERIRSTVDTEAVIAALEAGDLVAAEAALGISALPAELEEALATLRGVVAEAGRAVAEEVSTAAGRAMAFDVANPRLAEQLRSRGFELVTGVTDTSRAAMRGHLADVVARGRPAREAVPEILEHIGLTEPASIAVRNLEARLTEAGELSAEEMRRKVDRYAAAKLRDRAETLAQDQTLAAAGRARQECWLQARDEELIPATATRVVVVTEDDRTCPHCISLDGKEVPLEGELVSGVDGTVRALHTPLHTLCRCQEVLKLD